MPIPNVGDLLYYYSMFPCLGFVMVWACFGTYGQFRVHEFLVIYITILSRVSKIGKNEVNIPPGWSTLS